MTESNAAIKIDAFEKGMDYPSYRNHIKSLLTERKTTGTNHSEDMIAYTSMNDKRMDRWDKKTTIEQNLADTVKSLPKMNWLIITEAWCGDAAQNIPFIAKLANENPEIDLRFIMRDENLGIMDQYLTNGAKSIPILVLMDRNFNDLDTWGPRPQEVQQIVMDAKSQPDIDKSVFIEKIHKWYSVDKNKTISKEFQQLLNTIQ